MASCYGSRDRYPDRPTLTQDATGTLAFLQFEALGIERVRNELAVSYVDHNMLQAGLEAPMITCSFRLPPDSGCSFHDPATASATRSISFDIDELLQLVAKHLPYPLDEVPAEPVGASEPDPLTPEAVVPVVEPGTSIA